jgi:hypothetical protein
LILNNYYSLTVENGHKKEFCKKVLIKIGQLYRIEHLTILPENADVSDLLPMARFKSKNGGNTPAHTPLSLMK